MNDFLIELEGPLAWVRINRPDKRNALSSAMWSELPTIATRLAANASTRVVLLTGVGNDAFSAGADISEMQNKMSDPAAMAAMQEATQRGQQLWAELALPTIAVIRGACTGGGCGLALCCDIRIAADDSYFAIPPAKLGLVYSLADSKRLVDAVGPARAKEWLFTGRRVSSREALDAGLLNQLVPTSELEVQARQLALSVAEVAQSSVRTAKHIVNAICAGQSSESTESRKLFDHSFSSADFREGAAAFVEKRKPKF